MQKHIAKKISTAKNTKRKKATATAKRVDAKGGVKNYSRKRKVEPNIDWERVRRLGRLHCRYVEAAEILGVPHSWLVSHPNFPLYYRRGYEQGKKDIRVWQRRLARRGNASMCIWLGKQYLGQKEDPQPEETMATEMTISANRKDNLKKHLSVKELKDLQRLVSKAENGEVQ